MMGEFDLAIADLTHCIGLNPNQPEPYNSRAAAFAQKGDYIAAVADFARAIDIRPQYAGRDAAASPATGLAKRHAAEQAALIEAALGHSSPAQGSAVAAE